MKQTYTSTVKPPHNDMRDGEDEIMVDSEVVGRAKFAYF